MKEKQLTVYVLYGTAQNGEAAYELCYHVNFEPFGKLSVGVVGVDHLPNDITECLSAVTFTDPLQANMLCELVNLLVEPEDAFSVHRVTEVLSDV